MIVVVEVHNVAGDVLGARLLAAKARDALTIRGERPGRVALEDDVHELAFLEPRVAELPLALLDLGRVPLPVDDRVDRARHPAWAPDRHADLVRPSLPARLPRLRTSGRRRRTGSGIRRSGSAAGDNDGNRHEEYHCAAMPKLVGSERIPRRRACSHPLVMVNTPSRARAGSVRERVFCPQWEEIS